MQSAIRYTPPVRLDLPQEVHDDPANQLIIQGWDLNPFFTDPNLTPTFDRLIRLFRTPDLNRPSNQAELTQSQVKLSSTIQMVDTLFVNAIEDYRQKLINALKRDLTAKLNPVEVVALEEFTQAIAVGAARMVQRYTPNIPIVQHISALTLLFIGAFWGYFNQATITKERTDERCSAHRQLWLQEVAILEKNRKMHSLNLIKQRLRTIHLEIERADDLIDMKLIDELKALNQLNQGLDPEHPLLIGELSVPAYIQQKFPCKIASK